MCFPHKANTLVNEGPSLATKLPVDKIPKGQDQVIAKAMSEPVTIVWGPPGTGKTHTMSELAIRFIEKGYSMAGMKEPRMPFRL